MKDAGHLIRLAALFVVGLGIFLAVRAAIVPAGFGKYGHYRAGALDDIRQRPISFAGRATCEMCHDGQATVLHAGKHTGVGCEACHGAQAHHANLDDPSTGKPVLPDTRVLCRRCHEANSAKPKNFPQVVVKDHAGAEPCKRCHTPHNPKIPG
jgi:hypothetical protein